MLAKSHIPPTGARAPRPGDATLSVTKAAHVLGVHPNTIRAWSDAGRLRYYRINPRGDRRYRLGDLQRFMAAAETGAPDGVPTVPTGSWGGRRSVDPSAAARFAPSRRIELEPGPDSEQLTQLIATLRAVA